MGRGLRRHGDGASPGSGIPPQTRRSEAAEKKEGMTGRLSVKIKHLHN